MTFRARIVRDDRRRGEQLDARALVRYVGDAVAEHLSDALVDGVSPVDGGPRTRKADGKPRGYDTGLLARSIKVESVSGGKARAKAKITAARSREPFLDKYTDVMTFEGQTARTAVEAIDDYLQEIAKDGTRNP